MTHNKALSARSTAAPRGAAKPATIDEVDELENDDVDMEPGSTSTRVGKAVVRVKKDKREIRSLIDNARSTPAKITPVARGGPKRKSIDLTDHDSDKSSQRYICLELSYLSCFEILVFSAPSLLLKG